MNDAEILVRYEEARNNPQLQAELQGDLGYKTYGSVRDRVSNIKRSLPVQASESEEIEHKPVVNLPKVQLRRYKSPPQSGDEEVAILHVSDGHAGKVTKSFNDDVYKARMWKMFESAMVIVHLHRKMYPIRKLYILNTGDNAQGENPHQGSVIGEVSMGARDQVNRLAGPMWNNVIASFRQEFDYVEFNGWPGNHGYEKLAPATSKLDIWLYDILKAGIDREDGIKINVHDEWASVIEIMGFRCFCFHGDGMPCQAGVPYFALDKKLKSWYMQYGGFEYAFSGHFHKQSTNEVSSKLEHFMCASLVSDDEWALKKLGISSHPSQSLYGLHPERGITWRYNLTVDDEFLPQKQGVIK